MKNYMKPKPIENEKCAKCGTEVKSFMLNRDGICGDCLQAKWDAEARAYSASHPIQHNAVADFFGGEDNFTAPTAADLHKLDAECAAVKAEQEKLDAMMEHCQ